MDTNQPYNKKILEKVNRMSKSNIKKQNELRMKLQNLEGIDLPTKNQSKLKKNYEKNIKYLFEELKYIEKTISLISEIIL